jgi:hypothetical protein
MAIRSYWSREVLDALVLNTKGWKTRAITEPENEKVLRGPREGFNESLMFNLSALRRKLRTQDLKCSLKPLEPDQIRKRVSAIWTIS